MRKQLFEKYSDLWDYYSGVSEVETNINPLLDLWQCTRRNVNLILTQLQNENCIKWVPEHGRGKQSKLYFLKTPQTIKLEQALVSANEGDLESAFAMVDSLEEKRALLEILETNLGFKNIENKKDVLRIPYFRPIPYLDPIHSSLATEVHIIRQMFDNLVQFDPKTQKIVPHLAHAWMVKDEGKQWTFYLRKHVYFHHNREMTSKDVKNTLQCLISEKSAVQSLFQNILKIRCDSDYQVTIFLKEEHQLFLHLLSGVYSVIFPVEQRKLPEFSRLPIGTGPFKIVKNNDYHLVLAAFPQYFGLKPLLDRIEIWFFENKEVRLQKNMDIFLEEQVSEETDRAVHTKYLKGYFNLICNMNKPGPLQDIQVREFIKQQLSPQRMNGILGKGITAYTILPEWGKFPLKEVKPKKLKPGVVLNLVTFKRTSDNYSLIRKELQALGIKVNLMILPSNEFCDVNSLQEADLVYYGAVVSDHMILSLFEYFASDNSPLRQCLNKSLLAQVDQQLRIIQKTSDREKQFQYFKRLSQFVIQERIILPLFHDKCELVSNKKLKGIHFGDCGWITFKDLWFQQE